MNPKSTRVVSFMNAFSAGRSGGDVAFIEVARRMPADQHIIITSGLGKKLCQIENVKADYIETTTETEFRNVSWTYLKRIVLGVLRSLFVPIPNVIYVSSDILPDVIPALVLKARGALIGRKPLLLQKFFHLNQRERLVSSFMQRSSLKLIRLFADQISTCSHQSKAWLLGLGFPADNISVNYLGVNLEDISNVPAADRRFDAIFLGRLHESKGVFDLVKIWAKVAKEFPDATIGVIGIGEDKTKAALEEQIAQHGLQKKLYLLGYRAGEAAYGLIKKADFFIFPSHEEGFGIVLAEAMACEAAIVAYDLPVYAETFKPAIAVAKCFDTEEFAQHIVSLMRNEKSRKELQEKGAKLVQNFTWRACAEREFAIMSLENAGRFSVSH